MTLSTLFLSGLVRRVIVATMGSIVVIAMVVAEIDRPAATLAFTLFHAHRAVFDSLTHLIDPLPPAATLGLLVAAMGWCASWRAEPAIRVAITCCVAVVLVVTLKDQAKYGFGRLWPETWVDGNPSWIGNGAYGFYPFHGGRGYASFPSGHMAVITAPAAVLWRMAAALRALAATAVILVAVGLYGADYHFVSDIIAGTLVGAASGLGAVALVGLNWWPRRPFIGDPERVRGRPAPPPRVRVPE